MKRKLAVQNLKLVLNHPSIIDEEDIKLGIFRAKAAKCYQYTKH